MNKLLNSNKNPILRDGLLLSFLILIVSGCIRKPEEVWININLDWKEYIPPKETMFVFYGNRGTHTHIGNPHGFQGFLPPDTYQVIVYNTDMKNAHAEIEGSYHTDKIVAAPALTRTDNSGEKLGLVDRVFGTGIQSINLSAKAFSIEVQPLSYAKKVTFFIDPGSIPDIESVHLRIDGIIKSRYITRNEAIETGAGFITDIAGYDSSVRKYSSIVSALGYTKTSRLIIELHYTGGHVETTVPIHLAEHLAEFPEDSKTVEFTPIFPEGKQITVSAFIHGWNDGAPGAGVVE